MTSLAVQLLGASRTAILSTLLLRPEDALHVREIARVTGISPGTLHRELRALAELGLLSRRETGRQVFYSANRGAAVFKDLASLLRKTAGLGDVLKAALVPLVDRIRVAFVYGSTASGTAQAHSDVDLMLLGSATFAEVVKALHRAQATVGREINPTVMSVAEFNRRRRERDGFVMSISKAPKIWLFGDDDDCRSAGSSRSGESTTVSLAVPPTRAPPAAAAVNDSRHSKGARCRTDRLYAGNSTFLEACSGLTGFPARF